METKNETNLSKRQQIVLEWFSKEPYKPENLWNKLKDRKLQITLSRPTSYRALKALKKINLIYHLTEEDKQNYGIVEKGSFYFRSDPKRKERWEKLIEKVKEFNGTQNIGVVINIMKREFENFPLVTNADLVSTLDTIMKMSEDNLWSLRGNLLSFLENHVKRMFYKTNNSDYNLQRKTQDLFHSLLTELHNGPCQCR